jgi:hypothetical protein
MNVGYSSKMCYDDDFYADRIQESTYGLNYRINKNLIYNDNRCRSDFGPRTSYFGNGVSVPVTNNSGIAEAQNLTHVENILTNRNFKTSRSKKGGVNPVNPITTFTNQHQNSCSVFADPMYSLETNPRQNYRSLEINRFENLYANPQNNIFYDWAINSNLEAIDNFIPEQQQIWPDLSGPKAK